MDNKFEEMLLFTKQCEAVGRLEEAALELWELSKTTAFAKEFGEHGKLTIHKDGISIVIQTVNDALIDAEAQNRGYDRSTTSRIGITSD